MNPSTTSARFASAFQYQGREPQHAPQQYCGAKRERSSTFAGATESIFKPKLSRGRLSSFLGESLSSQPGLSKTPLLRSCGEFSATSLASVLPNLKSRGRAVSFASEKTTVSTSLPKCCKCGQSLPNLSNTSGSQYLSPPSYCLVCMNFSLNKSTSSSPLLSVFTKAHTEEGEFKLSGSTKNDEISSRFDMELNASEPSSPSNSPVRNLRKLERSQKKNRSFPLC
ncbi:unnamed protein product [Moneuplotes crassus]|uniref:Uncharacterized protein n=1 Tax=Euplotes crassus TaxID=5936 RepID=A0AAD1UFE3_EUPCR|nr:unnamed protein product [Moneuplotes crassus]